MNHIHNPPPVPEASISNQVARRKDWLTAMAEANTSPPRPRHQLQVPIRNVSFFCDAPAAAFASVSGDFNYWHRTAAPMHRRRNGGWVLTLALHQGHHQYYFLVDGRPTLDPKALGTAR